MSFQAKCLSQHDTTYSLGYAEKNFLLSHPSLKLNCERENTVCFLSSVFDIKISIEIFHELKKKINPKY